MRLSSFVYRAVGAACLDGGTYEGVEHDTSAIGQAALVVLASSLAAGIGAGGWHGPSLGTTLAFALVALATWIAWAFMTFQIGTRVLPGPATASTFGELLRTVGFAAAPGVLQIFAAFPRVREWVFAVAWLWMFAAMVVAIKHALDYERLGRAVAVCALATLLIVAAVLAIGLVAGPTLG